MTADPPSEPAPSLEADRPRENPDDAARAALQRVLRSPEFSRSARSRACLQVIVEQSLAERAYPLKEREIAKAVLGSDRSFDPATNPWVRVQVGRMRARLVQYYEGSGAADPIRIVVPVGRYSAEFVETTSPATPTGAPPPTTAVRIAVLNLAEGHADVATGSSMAERIVADLTRFPGIEVIGPLSRGSDDHPDPIALADHLEAHVVLDGSVRQDGARSRVTARMIDGATGVVLWSGSYEDAGTGAASLEGEGGISARVAAALADYQGVAMRMPSAHAGGPGDPIVFDALRRYYAWSDVRDFDRYGEVVDLLEHALRIEPHNTTVMSILAGTLHLGPTGRNDDPTGRGIDLARRAHEMDPSLAIPLLLFALHDYQMGNLEGAITWTRRAVPLSPNHPTILYTAGSMLIAAERWEEGLELVEQAMDLTPNHPDYWFAQHAMDALRIHDWKRALTLGRRVGDTAPPWGNLIRAAALAGLGLGAETHQELAALRAQLPGFDTDRWGAIAALQDIPGSWVPLLSHPIEAFLAEAGEAEAGPTNRARA